jgi:ubiquinone/menaquinone biosynthesis C-methylase UbiE
MLAEQRPELLFEGKEREIQQEWDVYWSAKNEASSKIYEIFADFYRNTIIKPTLNHFIYQFLPKGSSVLHAGCGSGKVDQDIVFSYNVTALDISYLALQIYDRINLQKALLIQASIFDMPFENDSFEGVYNLGVMEHFTEEEINQILREFKRVLKPNGKIILFIPPVYGLTVWVLDFTHFILNQILHRNVKLHPDEITRIKSKQHVLQLLEKAEFKYVDYYFGIKDLFTQVVIVAEK